MSGGYFVPIASAEQPTALGQSNALADQLWAFSAKFISERGF